MKTVVAGRATVGSGRPTVVQSNRFEWSAMKRAGMLWMARVGLAKASAIIDAHWSSE